MEGEDQRRRQYEQSNYGRGYGTDYRASTSNVSSLQSFRGVQVADIPDQFSQEHFLTTQAPTSLAAGPQQDLTSFAYTQGQQYQTQQMHASSVQYPTEYLQDPQRQRFPVQYPSMTYNVAQQPQSQLQYNTPNTQSAYGHTGQFQPRQTAATDVISSQFGVPPQYYSGGDAPSTSAPSIVPQGYQTTPYQQSLQYNAPSGLGRSTLASPYPTAASELRQGASESNAQQEAEAVGPINNNNQIYQRIGEINESTSRSMLIQASNSLRQTTRWLVRNIVSLGTFLIRVLLIRRLI